MSSSACVPLGWGPSRRANLDSAIQVHCYAGHRGEQTPRRFMLGDRRIEVVEVVDAWLGPDHRYFKVVGDDGSTYLLRHGVAGWRLVRGADRTV